MRKLTHVELLERQQKRKRVPKLPFCVVLNHIRSLHNVGSIFRTADGAGVEKLYLCGITGHPPDSKITKTALSAEKEVPWEYCQDAVEVLRRKKQEGYEIDVQSLSGGEKTSVALAYRIALNTIVKQEVATLRRSLLTLDEPTDGLSSSQLYKLRDILRDTQCEQIIIVSHEKELEGFVDMNYKVTKENGTSRVSA